jgi:hypothetical protein
MADHPKAGMDSSRKSWRDQVRWGLAALLALVFSLASTGVVVVAATATATARADALSALPALGLAADSVTVSGLSSGGYMAGQFQVAFSGSVAGAAVLAGGPYGCSRGAVSTAAYNCSCPANPGLLQQWLNLVPGAGCTLLAPSVLAVFADAALKVNRAELDDPKQLARQRVWLFSGGRDAVVPAPLVDAAEAFYLRHGVAAANLHHERVDNAAHGLPAPDATVACDRTTTPFLIRCPGQDAAGELLAWLYGTQPGESLLPASTPRAAGLRRFDQRPYRQPGVFDGLDDSGWVYLPAGCELAGAHCRLHVVFHGCLQSQRASGPGGQPIGRQFVDGAGYNRWAEANAIVVLYPQVLASQPRRSGDTYRLNPDGCWDFWGYTDAGEALSGAQRKFARRSAPQLSAVKTMVDALLRPMDR